MFFLSIWYVCHFSSFIYYIYYTWFIYVAYMHTYRWYYIDKSYLNIVCAYFFLKPILLSSTFITRTNADSIDFSSINDICILHFYFISFHHLFILEKKRTKFIIYIITHTYMYDIECISKWNEISILLFIFSLLNIL